MRHTSLLDQKLNNEFYHADRSNSSTPPMAMTPQFQQAYADRLDRCIALTTEEKAGLKDLMIQLNWLLHTYRVKTLMEDPHETTHLEWSDNNDFLLALNRFGLTSATITDIFFVDRFEEECESHLLWLLTS